MGARIVIHENRAQDFACRTCPDGIFAGKAYTEGLSPRCRRLTNVFKRSEAILQQANESYGRSNNDILLLPDWLDKKFYGSIEHIIQNWALNPDDVMAVHISYHAAETGMGVHVNRLESKTASIETPYAFHL